MSVVLTRPQFLLASKPFSPRPLRWSREQYYRLGELGMFRGRRVELIRGEIIEMSPIGWSHSQAKSLVVEALRKAFPTGHWFNEQNPFVIDESEPEPDVAVIPGDIRDYSDHPTQAALIVEVADTSLDYDTTTKARLYAEAGVLDYWVLDLTTRRLHVFRDPVVGGTEYRTQFALESTASVSPLAIPSALIPVADMLP